MILEFLSWFLLGALAALGAYFLVRLLVRRAFYASLETALYLVRVPNEVPEGGQAERDFAKEIGKFEQLLGNLASFRKSFVFEIAVPHVGEEIHFFIAVPRRERETAVKQIQGIWNGASVEAAPDDYNIFNAQGISAASYLLLKEHYALPVRTYNEIGADTFSSIAGAFTRVNMVGEGAALQVIARPASRKERTKMYSFIRLLKKGEPLEKVVGHAFPFGFAEAQNAFQAKSETTEERERIVDEDAVKSIEAKAKKPLYEVNVRLVSSAGTSFQAQSILDGLAAGFSQFSAPGRNEFRFVKPRQNKKLIYQYVFRNFDARQKMLLNSEEIASFYHFPTPYTETPRIKWLKAKEAPPPAVFPEDGVLLGESVFRGQMRPVRLSDDDRRRHIYVVGQTGTGKSTLMTKMVIDDIQRNRGVAMIDPHGDLAETILGYIPKNRAQDLIYFDPSDLWRPVGLNMLDFNYDRPEEKTFIVNEMQGIFNKLFPPETMGPMFEQYMRNALLLLMEDMPNEPATLMEVPRVFVDSEYRKRKVTRIKNLSVIDFWEKEAAKAGGEASLANMTPYITSKFNNFISNDYMRPIIGQERSAFNFRACMDEGKILLINLSKGRIGDINAALLGMVVTGKLLMAALSRVDIPDQNKRRDFNLYIDEFQNFTTDSISTILSEARKYRLNLTVAHQFIAQLTEKTRDAVFGNVGSQVVFRVGVQDAEFLVKQFEPIFSRNDLINIDNFNAYVRILVRGETTKPFNMRTLSLEPGDREFAHELKEYSRMTYGVDRQAIEESIYRRLRG
ncbi:MAG: DUF87 domain-containing protein [Candidatus Liptonbacteria bacterium]|nr:DUF87 domain-containing protein [Candidatus Liptonbacteria bacterium]